MIDSAHDLPIAELASTACASDACVIGAGPAGLSFALRLAEAGARVVVLDSGPSGGSREAEKLSKGEAHSFLRVPLHEMRKRGVGGTSRAWASNLARLEPTDLEPAGDSDNHWPISFDEVAKWIDPALRRLGSDLTVSDHESAEAAWRDLPLVNHAGFVPRAIAATATGNVGASWRREIENDPRVHLITDIHASRLSTTGRGHAVDAIEAYVMGRTPVPVVLRPPRIVLATGGIEAPRLLLASTSASHPEGIGNHSDHLGRWYQDHPFAWCGSIEASEPGSLDDLLFPAGSTRSRTALGPLLRLDDSEIEACGGVNSGIFVLGGRPWMAGPDFNSEAMTAFRRTLRAARAGHLPVSATEHAIDMAGGAGALVRVARHRRHRSADHHVVRLQVGATPRWDSRVTLAGSRDRFGVPIAAVDWRVGDAENVTARRTLDVLAAAATESGAGLFHPVAERPDGWPSTIEAGYHPSGATRMSKKAEDGVVDTDLRVHGLDNLWVLSSSIFPSIGYANPTLTVVALGFRLAEHLRCG